MIFAGFWIKKNGDIRIGPFVYCLVWQVSTTHCGLDCAGCAQKAPHYPLMVLHCGILDSRDTFAEDHTEKWKLKEFKIAYATFSKP